MFKLLVVSSVLMVVAASPSYQLLSSLPPEETISLPSLPQPEQPSAGITSSSSSEESAEPPASTRETPVPTQSAPTPSETSTTTPEPSPAIEPLSEDEFNLLSASALGASSLGSASIQHQILPPETISLPIRITTSPGLRTVLAPETIRIHQPTVTKVGELVQKIPTAVSHQSQTVVHKHAEIITPIVAPAIRTITSQVVRAYHTPLVYAAHAPVIKLIQH